MFEISLSVERETKIILTSSKIKSEKAEMGSLGSSVSAPTLANFGKQEVQKEKKSCGGYFQMPLHYPRYTKADYESMPEWKIDCLLREYGLPVMGNLDEKRKFAMGAFLWPSYSSHDK